MSYTSWMLIVLLVACQPQEKTDTAETGASPLDSYTLAGEVSADALLADITVLQDFGTRHTGTPGNDAARAWISDALTATGIPTEEDPFDHGVNVIARLEGTVNPDTLSMPFTTRVAQVIVVSLATWAGPG